MRLCDIWEKEHKKRVKKWEYYVYKAKQRLKYEQEQLEIFRCKKESEGE